MKTILLPLLILGLLSTNILKADLKIVNSYQCAEKIPGAKELMADRVRIQSTAEAELQEIGKQYKKMSDEMQKDYNDLMALQATSKADSPDLKKARTKVEEKQNKLQELQAKGQRLMQEAQQEMQLVEMKLQPYIGEAIQNAIEVASKAPTVEAVWDEATNRIIYKKDTADFNAEVIKLTEKKNDQKTAVAKNKADTTPKAPAKVV